MQKVSKIISNIVGASVAFILCYFVITGTIGILFGIKSPQPFFHPQPYSTILSDPHADKSYSKTVNPNEIQKVLDSYHYTQKYKEGQFDCSDMSQQVAKILVNEGYHASVIGDDKKEHAWVIVWVSKNSGWAIEATSVSDIKNNIGEVVGDDWYDFHFVMETMFDKKPFELYYPTVKRDGLHVLDWDDAELKRR